jgi:hypothetical protein
MRYTREPGREHRLTAWIGIIAIAAAIVAIAWAHIELHGLEDLDKALDGAPATGAKFRLASSEGIASVDAAVASGRWATGFSQ